MKDKYGREVDYVRISITDRCNLRCIYCMPEEGICPIPHEEILTYEEITRICRGMVSLGIHKVKITGGEPLVRKDCAKLVRMLKEIPGMESVTLTTNGVKLKEQIADLAEAGIDAINISLDTMNREKFKYITRRDRWQDVIEGIHETFKYPFITVKINTVPIIKEKESIWELAALAKEHPISVRFIEMMPIGYGKEFEMQAEESIREVLEEAYGKLIPLKKKFGNGPCRYFELEGFEGKIGFISAVTHKFCEQCNRVRLTADGYLKSCLQYQTGVDLKAAIRQNCEDDELNQLLSEAIYHKPAGHNFNGTEIIEEEQKNMSQIGG